MNYFEIESKYRNSLKSLKAETREFEQLTGLPFTIANARRALLDTAKIALDCMANDENNGEEVYAAKNFNQILKSLPYKNLTEIAFLIKLEILAHLQLSYGAIAVMALTDGEALNLDTILQCSLPHFTH